MLNKTNKCIVFNRLVKIFDYLCNFWWPHSCCLCHRITKQAMDICDDCLNDLPIIQQGCISCGKLIPSLHRFCAKCLHRPPFDYFFCLCYYKDLMISLITDLKFHQQLNNAKILGQLMAKKLIQTRTTKNFDKPLPEYLIPVPLHKDRLKERGFNQALELARPISKQLKIPIYKFNCQRIKNTKPQTLIPIKQRKKNIKNAFSIKNNINAKHVAIIDDVFTTGHTTKELAKELKKSGVEIIEVWCCAKAIRR